jgi:L-lactate dehydrogenase complex protein LldE
MTKVVGIFITCLADLFRPQIVFATIKLLEKNGCQVEVPTPQTCCGQPAYNSGDKKSAQAIARQVLDSFARYDYIVAPSASCAGMLKKHYPLLFKNEPEETTANRIANNTYELTQFLHDVLGIKKIHDSSHKKITYHDSCSALRELNIQQQPRELLNITTHLPDANVCCGFGGTFCVKYSDISNKMVSDKVTNIMASGANIVTSTDLGCLMNISGKLQRENSPIQALHIAEILASDEQ